MARKGRAVNKRKTSSGSPGGGRPLLTLLVVAALIAAAFFALEHFRNSAPPAKKVVTGEQPKPSAKGVTGEQPTPHLRLPERPVPQQKKMSSASLPAPKPHPAELPRPAALQHKGPGQVAIIIDDMGSSMQEVKALLSIELPITFSVIPGLGRAKGVAEAAHGAGAEVMLHMPMEPEGYPNQRLESVGLLVAMENAEIAERVNGYFKGVPHAVGANNHMGSRFTQHAEKMEVVLKVLKGKGVFFVDSKTSPASVGYQTARALGLRCATRQVFLDNVQNEAAIGRQLAQVAAIARKRGSAIAICHPHPSTIRALKSIMPQLARSGITFVYASALVT